MIRGKVIGQDDSAAILVELIFAGELVDRTDANGDFSFAVPKKTKRVIVTFRDRIIKKFQEEDKIFNLNEGQTVTYRVKLREKPKPITFNASEPLELPLGGESDSFADLEIPENSLLTQDGSVFSGNAKVTVSVTDPRNQSDILTAPGDFTTMNEDGEVEMLETYGMIKLNLEDDNGKPLAMSKPMKVYLDPEKLNITVSDGNASVKLYWLDRKTGRWRETGDFIPEDGSNRRRKRSNRIFLAGSVTPSIAQEYINLDWPSRIVGLRVTTDTEESGVMITAIRKDHKGYVERITNNGVVCMPIWKDKEYYLQAEKNFEYYDPDPALQDFSTTFQHVKETCFIKVTISGTNVLFMAASYKKDDQTYTGIYGFHLRMPKAATSGSDKVVCLQFRCPRQNDHTALLLTPMTSKATCILTQTDADLDKPQSNKG
ncbi:cartilage intermediate layer protein 1-like [Orbicella faveolata]|uniref:cartilage intermediate layer protein 1-like n=1 Tax=Orbicella faveolata TaxID=48498 RepID=UPI0009E3BEA5|nr:cartilage intermediate layer protein 1-like [Orbicella faveolata]